MSDNFQSAKSLITKEETEAIAEAFRCANWKRHRCRIPKRQVHHAYCTYCKMLMSIGGEFFIAERDVTQDEAFAANEWQLHEYAISKPYWERWMENFPRGA